MSIPSDAAPSLSRLQTLILAEYREMPCMRLTLKQAARLWNAAPDDCERVLQALVGSGFLFRDGVHFVRAEGTERPDRGTPSIPRKDGVLVPPRAAQAW